jgi:hypothetical protein
MSGSKNSSSHTCAAFAPLAVAQFDCSSWRQPRAAAHVDDQNLRFLQFRIAIFEKMDMLFEQLVFFRRFFIGVVFGRTTFARWQVHRSRQLMSNEHFPR